MAKLYAQMGRIEGNCAQKEGAQVFSTKGAIVQSNANDSTTQPVTQQFLDASPTYWAERWGLVRYLPSLHDAALFLAQIGGRL